MAAAKPHLLLHRTLRLFSPQFQSFSTAPAPAPAPLNQLQQPNEAQTLDDAHYLSLVPAAVIGAESTDKPLAVLKFLKSSGLDDAHITRFVAKRPKVLFADVDNNLAPKFQLFQSLGMSAAEVAGILGKTSLLNSKLTTHLAPRIGFLRSILHSDEDVVRVCKRSVWSLSATDEICKKMLSIISICKELGFTDGFIKNLIVINPRNFQLKPELIRQAIGRVKTELGVEFKSDYMYFSAITTLCQLDTHSVVSKFNIFKNFGWSMTDILALVRCQPSCLLVKNEKLSMGLEFLMKTAGFSPSYLASHPTLLMMSLESRIIPRYNAFTALKLKNLISQERDFYSAAIVTEELFLKRYLLRFEQEAPDVCKAYLNNQSGAK